MEFNHLLIGLVAILSMVGLYNVTQYCYDWYYLTVLNQYFMEHPHSLPRTTPEKYKTAVDYFDQDVVDFLYQDFKREISS